MGGLFFCFFVCAACVRTSCVRRVETEETELMPKNVQPTSFYEAFSGGDGGGDESIHSGVETPIQRLGFCYDYLKHTSCVQSLSSV